MAGVQSGWTAPGTCWSGAGVIRVVTPGRRMRLQPGDIINCQDNATSLLTVVHLWEISIGLYNIDDFFI